MEVRLVKAEEQYDFIVNSRIDIMKQISMNPEGEAKYPLDNGIYLISFDEDKPVAMAEIFGYNQRFEDLSESIYSKAGDLSQIGPFEHFCHLRSLYIGEDYRHDSGTYKTMVYALTKSCLDMGKPIMTTGTNLNNKLNFKLFIRSGMSHVGNYPVEGQDHALLMIDVNKWFEGSFANSITEELRQKFITSDTKVIKERTNLKVSILKK